MRRHKRVSRRELKDKIRELEYETQCQQRHLLSLKDENSRLQEMYGRLLDRFNRLGTQIESLDSGGTIQAIEIKPIPFGQYAILSDEFVAKEIPDVIKSQIVNDMVSQLLENGYVQFITGIDNYPGAVTLGAKMYVVPWEQMARRRTVTLMVRSERKDDP